MKTIYRRLMHRKLAPLLASLDGKVLDLASSAMPSYRAFFRADRVELVSGDAKAIDGQLRLDFDARLPFEDGAFDHALCINALYIADDAAFTLKEMRRVVKPGGKLVIVTPFIFPEAREPHDYVRWTSEGLERLFAEAGLREVACEGFGGHFASAAFILEPLLRFCPLRFLAQQTALALDALVPERYNRKRPCPLGYLTVAKNP